MRITTMTPALLVLAGLLCANPAQAASLTPERLFADPDLNGPRARGVQLSPDGQIVSYLKGKDDNQNVLDLWAVDINGKGKGGEPYRLVDANQLGDANKVLSEAEKARRERQRVAQRGVVNYDWSGDSRSLLVPVDGDLFVVDRATHESRRLTETPADEVDAKLSPRSRYVSYVREQNLYVRPLQGGDERALTRDGGGTLSWATAEFVAQEEMDRDTGYWWSPNEQRIALTRVDESGVDIIERLDLGPQGATTVAQRYPRVGRPNAVVSLFVADVESGERVAVDLGKNSDIYIARVAWSRDSKTLYVQRQTRDQRTLDLLACSPSSGACSVLLSETSPHWVELTNDFRPLANGDFLWSSERSGYRHLYLYRRNGVLARQITSGDWPVTALLAVDERHRQLYFSASKDDPLGKQIFRVAYEYSAEPRQLTKGEGVWSATFADNSKVFVGTYSDTKTPPQTALYSDSGERLRWIEQNALDAAHPYHAYLDHHRVPTFGSLSADDGTPLYYSLATPPGFDPHKRYPAIVLVYGGPHVQTVTKAWGELKDQLYLAAGYVVFRIDNRGSDNRSVAFKTAIDRHLGTVEVRDQLVGVQFLKSQPYVDAARIGYSGWSYGGFMTLRMLTEPGAGIRAGAAGGPPTDFALYDTHYTERYMGTLADNADGYHGTDTLPRLPNLSGRLLLLHGMADDNVLFVNSTRLMEALQQRGVVFDLMDYPGQRHGVRGNAKQLQLWRTYLDFFNRELQPAGE